MKGGNGREEKTLKGKGEAGSEYIDTFKRTDEKKRGRLGSIHKKSSKQNESKISSRLQGKLVTVHCILISLSISYCIIMESEDDSSTRAFALWETCPVATVEIWP